MRIAGVDGRRRGWVIALVDIAGQPTLQDLSYHNSLTDVLASDVRAIAIDMPIGLADEASRECDVAARRLLRPHGSRVFPAPPRSTLPYADDYARACEVSRETAGKAISRQTWNLLPAIAEVDGFADDPRLVECHPEISFALMNGHPLDEGKKTPEGRAVRLDLLRRWLPELDDPQFGDDGLDALACTWSAARIVEGAALTLPAGELHRDAQGRPMRICA